MRGGTWGRGSSCRTRRASSFFGRYGQDVLVIWDAENPAADPFLQGALMVALACARFHWHDSEPPSARAACAEPSRAVPSERQCVVPSQMLPAHARRNADSMAVPFIGARMVPP